MSSNTNRQHAATRIAQVVGGNIAQARDTRDLTQHDLAGLLDTTDMQVSRWERGLHRPTAYFEAKLADVLFDGDLTALYAEPTPEAA